MRNAVIDGKLILGIIEPEYIMSVCSLAACMAWGRIRITHTYTHTHTHTHTTHHTHTHTPHTHTHTHTHLVGHL